MSVLSNSPPAPLKVENLTKTFNSFHAVDRINFEMKPGQVFGLLGPNGAGKTTALSMLVGLHQPTSGHVKIFGTDPFKEPKKVKPLFGYVPQELITHSFFTVEGILSFHAGYYGNLDSRKKREHILKQLDLWKERKKPAKALSGGMKRRLLIAKALMHSPKLLFLDEPTAGVDIELRDNLWSLVKSLKSENVSILLITHYLDEAENLCDEVAVMSHGKILEQDSAKNIISHFSYKKIKLLIKTEAVSKIKKPSHFKLLQEQNTLTLELPHKYSFSQACEEMNLPLNDIKDISSKLGNLEEAFRNIVRGGHA